MPFNDFLALCKVIRMIYGRPVAEKFFTKNIGTYYNLDSASLSEITKVGL